MKKNNTANEHGAHSLSKICNSIVALEVAYDDVAEELEDLAYFEYGHGGMNNVIGELERLVVFFENLRNKNEEVNSDLAQVYLLIGQIYQFAGAFDKSIEWINKSIIVNDMNPVAYHALATSFMSIGDESLAVKSLEREIAVEPGNYYTYLLLADIYEKQGHYDKFEDVIVRLLDRDPTNIRALHRQILFCERESGLADVELLRRRLLSKSENLTRIDAIIRAYHLAHSGRCGEAIAFLQMWIENSPDVSIVHLVCAHIYGMEHQYSKMRRELVEFKNKNRGRKDVMQTKIDEFADIFGREAGDTIVRWLGVAGATF